MASSLFSRGMGRLRRLWLRSVSQRHWARVHQVFAGRRGFVIGNGPSLRAADLELLADEISIASNKIYLIYDQTRWRPTLHTMIDPLVIGKIGATIHEHVPRTIVPEGFSSSVTRAPMYTYRYRGEIQGPPGPEPWFSRDVRDGLFCGFTVTYDNLQLAVHLGLDPIYLIGCDHYYAGEKDVVANQAIQTGNVSNHFHPDYRKPGEVVNPAPIALMTAAYEHARRFADLNGRTILNATRGGHLEVFERQELEKALRS